MRQVAIALLALTFAATSISCTTVRSTAPSSDAAVTRLEVRAGDTVRVLTKYRQNYTFKVTALDATSMSGEGVKVRYADIALIETKSRSTLHTVGAGLAVLEVVGLVVLAAHPPVGMPGP
jgi:hypothetical protein